MFDPPDDLTKYLPLVRNIAHGLRAHKLLTAEFDELMGDGALGLVVAAKTYDGRVPFRAWAILMIRRHMYRGYHQNRVISNYGSNDVRKGEPIAVVSLDDLSMGNPKKTIGSLIEDKHSIDLCRRVLFREVMGAAATLPACHQQQVERILGDNDFERGKDKTANNRAWNARWRTLRVIRTMVGADASPLGVSHSLGG